MLITYTVPARDYSDWATRRERVEHFTAALDLELCEVIAKVVKSRQCIGLYGCWRGFPGKHLADIAVSAEFIAAYEQYRATGINEEIEITVDVPRDYVSLGEDHEYGLPASYAEPRRRRESEYRRDMRQAKKLDKFRTY